MSLLFIAKYITLAETWLIFNNQDNKGKGYAINGRAITAAYKRMRDIREFEDRLHEENTNGDIPGFIHLYSGEEAVAVGICEKLNRQRLYHFNTPWTWTLYCKRL